MDFGRVFNLFTTQTDKSGGGKKRGSDDEDENHRFTKLRNENIYESAELEEEEDSDIDEVELDESAPFLKESLNPGVTEETDDIEDTSNPYSNTQMDEDNESQSTQYYIDNFDKKPGDYRARQRRAVGKPGIELTSKPDTSKDKTLYNIKKIEYDPNWQPKPYPEIGDNNMYNPINSLLKKYAKKKPKPTGIVSAFGADLPETKKGDVDSVTYDEIRTQGVSMCWFFRYNTYEVSKMPNWIPTSYGARVECIYWIVVWDKGEGGPRHPANYSPYVPSSNLKFLSRKSRLPRMVLGFVKFWHTEDYNWITKWLTPAMNKKPARFDQGGTRLKNFMETYDQAYLTVSPTHLNCEQGKKWLQDRNDINLSSSNKVRTFKNESDSKQEKKTEGKQD